MKRVTLNLRPHFIVEDDANLFALQDKIANLIMENVEGTETVGFGRYETKDVRFARCRIGPHQYAVADHVPADVEPTDICRAHWYAECMDDAEAEHKPLFDEVERLTGLKGHIEQTGGMTMTIVIPLPDAATEGEQQGYPCYMALKEGEEDNGAWDGSISFFRTYEDEDAVEIHVGYGEDALPPHQWAEKIASHYHTKGAA